MARSPTSAGKLRLAGGGLQAAKCASKRASLCRLRGRSVRLLACQELLLSAHGLLGWRPLAFGPGHLVWWAMQFESAGPRSARTAAAVHWTGRGGVQGPSRADRPAGGRAGGPSRADRTAGRSPSSGCKGGLL